MKEERRGRQGFAKGAKGAVAIFAFDFASFALVLFTGSYFTAPRPRFGRFPCTGDDSSQSRKACASALRFEFFITTPYCRIAGYSVVGTKRTYRSP